MTGRVKGILAAAGVLVLLGGAFAALKLTEPTESGESSTSSQLETIMLWEANTADINRVSVEQPTGDTYSVVRKIDTVDTIDVEGNPITQDVENYVMVGYEEIPMNTVDIRTLATRAPSLAAVDTVLEHATAEDMARFGLDAPIKVTFGVDNQDDISFLIGSKTTVDNNWYLCMAGGDTIYTVTNSAMEPFTKPLLSYLGTQVTEEQASDDETIVKSVRIARKNLDYEMYMVYDKYYKEYANGGAMALHVLEEPIHCLLSGDKSAPATHGLYGLTATEVVMPFPTEADLEKAGFNDPFVTVTVKTDDFKTQVFKLGNTYENADGEKLYYGYLDSVNCIYGFSAEDTIYDDVTPSSIASKNIIDAYVWDVGRLTCTAGDITLDFEGMGESAEDYVLKLNGEKQEDIERFRLLYKFLLETKAEELVLEEVTPTGKPLAEIAMEGQRNVRGTKLTFYDAGGMKAYIAVDGQVRFTVRKAFVEVLVQNLQMYKDESKAFITTW